MKFTNKEKHILINALEFDINTSDKTLEYTREKRQLLLQLKKEDSN